MSRVTTEEAIGIIQSAAKVIYELRRANREAREALEPLIEENAELAAAVKRLDESDAMVDEALEALQGAISGEEPTEANGEGVPNEANGEAAPAAEANEANGETAPASDA